MLYNKPELLLVGSASAVVLGPVSKFDDDQGNPGFEILQPGIVAGLDD